MLQGPTIIISCPHCGQNAKKRTLISGNTFGAEFWSDGKRIAPMLPDFPSLVLCCKCDKFYWVKDAKKVNEINSYEEREDKWKEIEYVDFPTFQEYFRALETIPQERFLRLNIWWSYNNYFREGKEKEITHDIECMNNENLNLLLTLLNESDDNDLMMKAEALRCLGRFEESRQLLEKVENPNLREIKEKFLAEINNKNIRVFRLF